MAETIMINKYELSMKEYKGQRVVTFKDIDAVHGRPEGTARKRFNDNKKYFIEDVDFFKVCASEIRTHKIMDISNKAHEDFVFVTESGYLMLVKSFTDDLAWEIQRTLVNSYFRVKENCDMDTLKKMVQSPDFGIAVLSALKEEQENRKRLEIKVEQDRPKVLFANAVKTSQTSILIGDMAKLLKQNGMEIGQNRLFEKLREENYLIKSGSSKNMPTQRAMEMGLFEVKERTINNPDGSIRITKTTKVTGKGQIYFINKFIGKSDNMMLEYNGDKKITNGCNDAVATNSLAQLLN